MKKLKAITLVESTIYLALFGIMFIAIMQFVITMRDNNRVAIEKVDLERVVIFLTNHISDTTKNATSIDETNSIFAQNDGKLIIIKDENTYEYKLENGSLIYTDNSTPIMILDPDYKVTRFYLEKIYNNQNSLLGTRLELTVESIKTSKNFKAIRTSYILK